MYVILKRDEDFVTQILSYYHTLEDADEVVKLLEYDLKMRNRLAALDNRPADMTTFEVDYVTCYGDVGLPGDTEESIYDKYKDELRSALRTQRYRDEENDKAAKEKLRKNLADSRVKILEFKDWWENTDGNWQERAMKLDKMNPTIRMYLLHEIFDTEIKEWYRGLSVPRDPEEPDFNPAGMVTPF